MSGTNTNNGATVIGNLIVNAGEVELGAQGANFTLNWARGNFQSIILAASGLTITAPAVGVGYFILRITQDATGSRLLPTFAPAITWLGGAPVLLTAAGSVDILEFFCNGSTFYGWRV